LGVAREGAPPVIKRTQVIKAQKAAAKQLKAAGIVLTKAEEAKIEVADFGLDELEVSGLQIVVYENNDRYCAKELILFPGQTCPEHLHPPVGNDPGKRETFRVRTGTVYVYVDGPAVKKPKARLPKGGTYRVFNEIVMKPGDQYTIEPGTWHWFQAGKKGAIVTEFSSTSRDEFDVFSDSRIKRIPEIEEDVKPAKKPSKSKGKASRAKSAK